MNETCFFRIFGGGGGSIGCCDCVVKSIECKRTACDAETFIIKYAAWEKAVVKANPLGNPFLFDKLGLHSQILFLFRYFGPLLCSVCNSVSSRQSRLRARFVRFKFERFCAIRFVCVAVYLCVSFSVCFAILHISWLLP